MPASRKRPSRKQLLPRQAAPSPPYVDRCRRITSVAGRSDRRPQPQHRGDDGQRASRRAADFLDSHLTERDRELALQSLRASANGDAAEALELYRQGLQVEGAAAEHELLDVILLGDEAPDWVLCRWIARQAYRWLLLTEDDRTGAAVRQTLAATYELPTSLTPGLLRRWGTASCRCLLLDLCELATYDLGGLTDYLDTQVSAALAERAQHIYRWAETPLCGYVYEGVSGDRLTIRDVGTGQRREVLHIGALAGTTTSAAHVIARVVPIGCSPGWMFAARPLDVDERTAREVSEKPESWLTALAVEDAPLPPALGQTGQTCVISDVVLDPPPGPPPGADVEAYDRRSEELTEYLESLRDDPAYGSDDAMPGRVRELVMLGVDPEITEAVCTVAMALVAAENVPTALPVVCPHAMLSLRVPGVFEALCRHSTAPES